MTYNTDQNDPGDPQNDQGGGGGDLGPIGPVIKQEKPKYEVYMDRGLWTGAVLGFTLPIISSEVLGRYSEQFANFLNSPCDEGMSYRGAIILFSAVGGSLIGAITGVFLGDLIYDWCTRPVTESIKTYTEDKIEPRHLDRYIGTELRAEDETIGQSDLVRERLGYRNIDNRIMSTNQKFEIGRKGKDGRESMVGVSRHNKLDKILQEVLKVNKEGGSRTTMDEMIWMFDIDLK